MTDLSDKEMLETLGVSIEVQDAPKLTSLQERVVAGFEDILRFVEEHGRVPQHGEGRDIFERLFAVRLGRIREAKEHHDLLRDLDSHGLLLSENFHDGMSEDQTELSDSELLAQLGNAPNGNEITDLKHVRPRAEVKAAEEIANREPCSDFAKFEAAFDGVQKDLSTGQRETRRFQENAEIKLGEFFILNGQMAFVAELDDEFTADYGRKDRRLRVIYGNKTESNLLLRSFQRALYKDSNGRRISEPNAGPLFSDLVQDGDKLSGTIYIARTKSDDKTLTKISDVLHKIGVTKGKAEDRIRNAKSDATFLFAEAQLIATYDLYNVDRYGLENLLQHFFANARLDIKIPDRFGKKVQPREWFVVPFSAIEEAIERLKDGSIADYYYDPASAKLQTAGS